MVTGRVGVVMGGRRVSVLVRAAVVLCLAAAMLAVVAPRASAASQPFASRFSTDDNGSIALFGNSLMTCPTAASGCAASQTAMPPAGANNNNFTMTYIDVDGDPSTFDSSSAQVTFPAGGTVLFAGLYWGARTQGTTFQGDPTRMLLRGPGGAYQPVTTQASFGPGTFGAYQQFADVTTTVQAGGAGTWWGANVAAATGTDRYAGWSLVVVFRDPAAPLRNLTVFDGYGEVSSSSGPQTITISGFKAPPTGTVQARVGMVAYEGDRASTGDRATLQNTVLSTLVSPGDNFFDSTIDRNGVIATDRNPDYNNTLGYDIKDVGVPGAIAPNSTSATITLKTGGETYNPGVVTTAIDIFAPDFSSSRKTVVDEAGNSPAAPGDTLLYTVTYPNTGQDPADRAIATDVLPPNVTYVPGSIEGGERAERRGEDRRPGG